MRRSSRGICLELCPSEAQIARRSSQRFMSGKIGLRELNKTYLMFCQQGFRVHRLDQRKHPQAQLSYSANQYLQIQIQYLSIQYLIYAIYARKNDSGL